MYQEPSSQQQIKHSLPTITISDPRTGRTVTWRMSQPVQIWSVGAKQWCPGEISYITQDADGYCLDVRYWAKPQLPKAKYLAPLSDCLRPISSDFTCRTDWTSGSKVECFSNSQKRWYKATVVDVIRYPDDKEDWLKIQWSLDINTSPPNISPNNNNDPSTPSTPPQIMSKEVGRSSIWIRHRYPSFKNSLPPNQLSNHSNISNKKYNKKHSHTHTQKNTKFKRINLENNIPPSQILGGPPKEIRSKEISYSIPYNNNNNKSKKSIKNLSSTSQHFPRLTPQINEQSIIIDENNNIDSDTDSDNDNDKNNGSSSEFGAKFKPADYQPKGNLKDMDRDMEELFNESDSDTDTDTMDSNSNSKPIIEQSETRHVMSNISEMHDDKKELIKEINELKFRLQITEQDLNEERETSKPLLKEVEIQKIRIAKLEELITNTKTKREDENNAHICKSSAINHKRSKSFASGTMVNIFDDNKDGDGDGNGNKTQELIDAIYDRKVKLLNDQVLRLQLDLKKRDSKIIEYKSKDKLRKREIQLLENELNTHQNEKYNYNKCKNENNISMYRDQVRKLTQINDSLKKSLQSADDKLKLCELKKQDLNEEFKIQRQIINNLKQKVQRVLQQNNTINNQIEYIIMNQNNQNQNQNQNSNKYNNYFDTIRKCNMRAIQILNEIIEKNRRKSHSNNYHTNNNNYNQRDEHEYIQRDEYERYPKHSTKSTRFSDHNNNMQNKSFNNNHHQQLSHQEQQLSHQEQQLLSNPHHQNDNYNNNNNNNNNYMENNNSQRIKRVSYDYVDGNQIQMKYKQKKKNIYMNHQIQQSFDENEEYFNKLWIVKFPRRSSKVQLFGGNKGYKTQILLENKFLIFKCDHTNNNLITKLNVNEIKNYEITEKKNLSIFTKNGKKYKIKCQQENESHFWYNILTQFIQQNT